MGVEVVDGPRRPERVAPDRASRTVRALLATGIIIVVCFGLLLRIWSLGRQPINSDEAIVGLMAHQILHGHFSAFYWGQSYGGGEPYVVAVVFALFGQSTFTLGLTSVLLDALAAVLVWRIGRRMFPTDVAIAAALLFWVWPEVYIWQSTIEYGFRWFVLDLGLASWLISLRLVAGAGRGARRRAVEWVALGLILGAGWWGSPEIVYYALPAIVYLAISAARRRLRLCPVEGAGLVLAGAFGALPWIWANARSNFASLRSAQQPDPSWLTHLDIFRLHVLPLIMGLQLRLSGNWVAGALVGRGAEYVAVAAVLVLLYWLTLKRDATLVVVFAVAAPFIYSASPFTWYWADGRYAVYLAPVAAMLVVTGAREICSLGVVVRAIGTRGAALAGPVVVAVGLALTVGAAVQLSPYRPNYVVATGSATWTSWRSDPTGGMGAVASSLVAHHLTDVYAGYWVANVIAFEARGDLVATDPYRVRYLPYLEEVVSSGRASWLFVEPGHLAAAKVLTHSSLLDPGCAVLTDRCLTPGELESYLGHRGIGYRAVDVTPFLAVVPDRAVAPLGVLRTYDVPGAAAY